MIGNILILETSTETGSVAIARGGSLLAEISFSSRKHATGLRSEALAPAVSICLAQAGISARGLTAVVCGAGPGGFTSLRSAAAVAKGLASALGIPLYGVSSLQLLVYSAELPEGTYIAALQAGRNEWFAVRAARAPDGTAVVGRAYLVGDDELRKSAARWRAQLIGHGLDHEVTPHAAAAIQLLPELEAAGPVDLDSWEPVYGRLAEAQVKWEAAHGRPLGA